MPDDLRRPADAVYVDTASDTAIGELLLDIASGANMGATVREKLISCAIELGAISPPRETIRFPYMVATDEDGAIAYTPSEEYAEWIADSLTLVSKE